MSRDDNISDSWENYADDSELEKRLQKERQEMATNGLAVENGNDDFKPRILQRPKVQQNQIKILKRPESAGNLSGINQAQNSSKPQIKTLEQREKEYAEARKRILGSESDQNNKQVVYNKVSPSTSSNNLQNYNQPFLNQQLQPQPQQPRMPDNNIIREPKGPNNSAGFRIRR